ncbi:MAG TPA: alpha/beta hydrolase-fold protein [Tepidisphaeraceae bacterium]|jgi:endo-1,4-beta-xylanase
MPTLRTLLIVLCLLIIARADAPPVQTDRWVTPQLKPNPLLAHHTFRSDAMNLDVGYNLYLPPDYEGNKDKRYPVLYWLHGMNQSESTDQYPIGYLDDAIKRNQIRPMIVVYASGGQRTYYTDSPAARSLPETAIIKELIPHIDATYRTIADRDHRAIAGMSMGGFGALKFAFKYPGQFSSVTAFAPAIRDPESFAKDRPDILRRMFANDPAAYQANHPATLLKEHLDQIRGHLPISLYVGNKDYLLTGVRDLHRLLTELKVDHTYQEFDGIEHNLVKLSGQTRLAPFELAARNFK